MLTMNISSFTNLISLHLNTTFVSPSHGWTLSGLYTALRDASHSTRLERVVIALSLIRFESTALDVMKWEDVDVAIVQLSKTQRNLKEIVFLLRILHGQMRGDDDMQGKASNDVFGRLPKARLADAPVTVVCRAVGVFDLDPPFEVS